MNNEEVQMYMDALHYLSESEAIAFNIASKMQQQRSYIEWALYIKAIRRMIKTRKALYDLEEIICEPILDTSLNF